MTALVVQDYLGGELLRAASGQASHYWNLLPGGVVLDLTAEQFGLAETPIATPKVVDRQDVVASSNTTRRYELLASAVDHFLRPGVFSSP